MPNTTVLLEDVFLSIGGVDLSRFVKGFGLTRGQEDADRTSISDLHEQQDTGAKTRAIDLEMFQDYAAGSVHETISPLSRTGEDVTVIWRPTTAAASASNPQYTLTMLVSEYTPEQGGFGDNAMATVKLAARSDEVRATS